MKQTRKQIQIIAVQLLFLGLSFSLCYGGMRAERAQQSEREAQVLHETTTEKITLAPERLEMITTERTYSRPYEELTPITRASDERSKIGELENVEVPNPRVPSTLTQPSELSQPKRTPRLVKPREEKKTRSRTGRTTTGGFRLSDVEAAEKGLKNIPSTTKEQNVQVGLDMLRADRERVIEEKAAAESDKTPVQAINGQDYYKDLELKRIFAEEDTRIKALYLADDKRLYNQDLFNRAVEIFKMRYPEVNRTDEVKKNANNLIRDIQNDLKKADEQMFKQAAEEKAQRIAEEKAAEKAAAQSPEAQAKKAAEAKAEEEKAVEVAKTLDEKMPAVNAALATVPQEIKDNAIKMQTFYVDREVKKREADLSTRISGQLLLTDEKNKTFGFTFLKEATSIKEALFDRIPRGKEGERDEAAYLRADKNYSNAKDAIERWSGEKMRYDRDIRALTLAGKKEEAQILRMKMDYEERGRIQAIKAPLAEGVTTKVEEKKPQLFETD